MSAQSGSIRAGAAFVELTIRDQKLVKGLARAGRALKTFSAGLTTVSNQMIRFGALAAIPFALAARSFAEFDKELRAAQGILGITDKNLVAVQQSLVDLSNELAVTETEAAKAFTELAWGGLNTEKALAALPGVLKLARAAGADFGETANGLVRVLGSFNVEAKDIPKTIDILATATVRSAQGLTELLDGFKLVAPIAQKAGFSVEDTAKSLSALANAGIAGSRASTGLARIFKNLAKSATQVQLDSIFGKGTVAVLDTAGDLRPVTDVLDDLFKATAQFGTGRVIGIFDEVFGRGTAAALNLTEQNLSKMTSAFDNLDGTAQRLSTASLKSMDATLTRIRNAVVQTAQAVAQSLKPELDSLAEVLQQVAKGAGAFIKANKAMVKTVARTVVQLLAAGLALKVIAIGIGIIGSALTLVGTLFSIVSVAAASFLSVLIPMAAALFTAGKAIAAWVFLGQLPALFVAIKTTVVAFIQSVVSAGTVFVSSFTTAIATVIAVKLALVAVVAFIAYDFVQAIGRAVGDVIDLFADLGRIVSNTVGVIGKTLSDAFGDVQDAFDIGGIDMALKSLKISFDILFAHIKLAAFDALDAIEKRINKMQNNLADSFVGGAVLGIRPVLERLTSRGTQVGSESDFARQDIQQDLADAQNARGEFLKEQMDAFFNSTDKAVNTMDFFEKASTRMTGAVNEVKNSLLKIPESLKAFTALPQEAAKRSQKLSSVGDFFTGFIDAVKSSGKLDEFNREYAQWENDQGEYVDGLRTRLALAAGAADGPLGDVSRGASGASSLLSNLGRMISGEMEPDEELLEQTKKIRLLLKKATSATFGSPV